MLLRLAYLGVTNAFAMLRLLPLADRNKDAEILALRHQITVLERRLGKDKLRFTPSDRAFLAALLHRLPLHVLRRRAGSAPARPPWNEPRPRKRPAVRWRARWARALPASR
ncbi:hypothetical protein [Streptomyces violaceusniger]|uniref:hypothetical protein n=1 Tax=Streptomyces violaceusniger TaxID=68280 RepID=UPI0036C017C1